MSFTLQRIPNIQNRLFAPFLIYRAEYLKYNAATFKTRSDTSSNLLMLSFLFHSFVHYLINNLLYLFDFYWKCDAGLSYLSSFFTSGRATEGRCCLIATFKQPNKQHQDQSAVLVSGDNSVVTPNKPKSITIPAKNYS